MERLERTIVGEMTGIRRLKISIFSILTVVVMFVSAAFSVSYAKWAGGPTEATAKGSVGKYYVEYPYTAQSFQVLEENTYYLAVQNKSGVTDYYKFGNVTNGSRYVNNVYIKEDTNVTFTYGTDVIAEPVYRPSYNTGFHGSYDTDNKVFKTAFDAVFDFELKSGNDFFDIIIDSKYPNIIELEFDDRTIELLCQTDSVNVHMWHSAVIDDKIVDTDLTPTASGEKKWPGQTCTASYGSTATTADNTNKIDLSGYASTDNVSVIFNYAVKDSSSYWQTMGMKIADAFGASDTYYLSFSEGTQSGTDYPLNMEKLDAITPSVAPVSAATDASDDMVVRKVGASTNADNSYTYKNYVCVSREYLATQTDKTVAYINFGVEGIGGDPLSANVTGFTVKRAATDADGNVAAGDGTSEFVYNSPEGKTLADINAKPPTGEQTGEHLKDNYVVGGTYVMLYFGEGKDRYYALDVTITTDGPANFTLTATASNVDRRHRFKTGYGEKLGYYLGGEFNGMDMWNPRFAAKLEKNGSYAEDDVTLTYNDNGKNITYSGPSYLDVSLTIELTAANDTIKLFRLNDSDGKRENGTAPTLWFIPYHIHKNYTDGIGVDEKKNLFNKDLNLIVAKPGTYRIRYVGNVTYKSDDFFAYDRSERVYLTKTEYYAIYGGGNSGASDWEKEQWIDENKNTFDGTKQYVLLGNWNGVVENMYVERIGGDPDKLIENVTVTFDPNGGTWDVTDNTETVKWGATLAENGLIRRQPTPPAGKMFDGWFDADGKQYDATTMIAPSSATLTLTARWVELATHTVTFRYNYAGAANNGVYATVEVEDRSTIDESKIPADPAARDGYTFGGWYKEAGCINAWDFASDTVSSTAKDIYAKWEPIKYTVTFGVNGYVGTDTVIEATYGDVITEDQAVIPALPSGLSSDLYEFGWYTTESGDTKVTFPLTVTGGASYFARWIPVKVRIVLDATDWLGEDGTDIYHVYAHKSAVELSGTWLNRALMTAIGENKYSIEFTDLPTEIIFTRDAVGSRDEVSRYTVTTTGIQLGNEYVYKAEMIKFVFDTTWDSWPNDAKIKYTFSDGKESELFNFIQTDRTETHLGGYLYIQVPKSVTIQFLQYPYGVTWTVVCTQASSYTYEAGATYTMTGVNWVSNDDGNKVKAATFTVVKS